VLITKTTSSAVMPGATPIARATIARGAARCVAWSTFWGLFFHEAGARFGSFRYKERTRSFHHPTVVVVRMISFTNLSMFS